MIAAIARLIASSISALCYWLIIWYGIVMWLFNYAIFGPLCLLIDPKHKTADFITYVLSRVMSIVTGLDLVAWILDRHWGGHGFAYIEKRCYRILDTVLGNNE